VEVLLTRNIACGHRNAERLAPGRCWLFEARRGCANDLDSGVAYTTSPAFGVAGAIMGGDRDGLHRSGHDMLENTGAIDQYP